MRVWPCNAERASTAFAKQCGQLPIFSAATAHQKHSRPFTFSIARPVARSRKGRWMFHVFLKHFRDDPAPTSCIHWGMLVIRKVFETMPFRLNDVTLPCLALVAGSGPHRLWITRISLYWSNRARHFRKLQNAIQ